MIKNIIHEKVPFYSNEPNRTFYIETLYRKLTPIPAPGIFHYHKSIELIYCISEKLKITLINNEIILNEGDFLFINSNTAHASDLVSDRNTHYCIKFDPVILNLKSGRPMPTSDFFFSQLPEYIIFRKNKDSDYIFELCKNCNDHFSHDNFSKRLTLQASIMNLTAYIFENTSSIELLNSHNKTQIFFDTVDYLEKNFATATLNDAAKNVSLSYNHFSRLFKREFHTSFPKYLTNLRLQKSMELLSTTSMSISSIAVSCGFSNLSHYTKCFKEEKGITPHRFRSIIKVKEY